MSSSTSTKTIKAHCLCGSANHEISLKSSDIPIKGHMCHCNSCRHTFGAMCATLVDMSTSYQPSPSLISKLTRYAFSPQVNMYFCPTCGCHMFCSAGEDPSGISAATWFIASGTMERIEGIVEWELHELVEDTLDGGFADFLPSISGKRLPRWPGLPGKGGELPLPWNSPDWPAVKTSPDDKLHASCKCEGVSFYISRPSKRSLFAKQYWPDSPPTTIPSPEAPQEEPFFLRDNNTKYLAGLCACNSCRLASGMETTTWAFVPAFQIAQDAEGTKPWTPDFGTLKQYQSSPGCYRYFCSRCGAFVFYDAEDRKWFKDIAMGLFHAPEGARAESWFGWRTSRLGYRDDTIPRAESYSLAIEGGLREWEERREGQDLSGGSQSAGAL